MKVCGQDLHAKGVKALAGAMLGVLAVAAVSQTLAQARGLATKHAVGLVNRLMSNAGIGAWDSFARRMPHQVGGCPQLEVVLSCCTV